MRGDDVGIVPIETRGKLMGFVAFLLATIQFALVGFGVTVVGSSELRNVAFGLGLLGLGLLLQGVALPISRPTS